MESETEYTSLYEKNYCPDSNLLCTYVVFRAEQKTVKTNPPFLKIERPRGAAVP